MKLSLIVVGGALSLLAVGDTAIAQCGGKAPGCATTECVSALSGPNYMCVVVKKRCKPSYTRCNSEYQDFTSLPLFEFEAPEPQKREPNKSCGRFKYPDETNTCVDARDK